jgi:general nucleoside transport system permease protein
MTIPQLAVALAAILASAAPLIFATMGETLGERAGVINLSLDGTMLLSAMAGFAAGLHSGNVVVGFLVAALVGMLVALVLCVLSISLRQSQTAVGFVLALLCTNLSSFLGNPYVRVPGVSLGPAPIPLLRDIPLVGTILFSHDMVIYASFVLVPVLWWLLFHTRTGLVIRALGERPDAAFARGVNVIAWRYACVLLGGALIGLAGAAYSLDLKRGWSHNHIAGLGWISLAIVIFGGWNPWRVALGCYLFSFLNTLATSLQSTLTWLPTQVFQVAPFVLMIGVLALVSQRSTFSRVPAALGKTWEKP